MLSDYSHQGTLQQNQVSQIRRAANVHLKLQMTPSHSTLKFERSALVFLVHLYKFHCQFTDAE